MRRCTSSRYCSTGILSAHGAVHWWMQRLTSLALVPLTLWFLCGMIRMIGATRDDVVFWMAGPLPIVLMIVLVIATFHHLQLGLQVVIEDYVHNDALRIGSTLLVKAIAALLALACVIAVLRLGL